MDQAKILFLDDMGWRHSEFMRKADERPNVRVTRVYTADQAIALLKTESFTQVFLDHDPSESDIMIKVGEKGSVPTGMDVVDHILTMEVPPPQVVVHSCNEPAAEEMERRLRSHQANIMVDRIPFPYLIERMR